MQGANVPMARATRWPGPRNAVRGAHNEVRGARTEMRGARNEVHDARNEERGARNEVRGTRNEVVPPTRKSSACKEPTSSPMASVTRWPFPEIH